MSLRSKIVLILACVIGLYGLVGSLVQGRIFRGRFREIERAHAVEDLERVLQAFAAEVSDVDALCRRWAAWDDTRGFLTGTDREAYASSNLGPESLARQGIDLLYFLGPDRQGSNRVVWGTIVDPETRAPLALRDFPRESLLSSHPLLGRAPWLNPDSAQDVGPPLGFLLTEREWPLIVSAHPIVGSDGRGEPSGTLVLGRFLGAGVRDRLRAQTRVDFDAWQVDGRSSLPHAVSAVLDQVTGSSEPLVTGDGDELLVYGPFSDLRRRPEILVGARVSRQVTATGEVALSFGLVSTIAGGFVLLLALTWLLQRIVLAPLSKLTEHAVRIGSEEDFRAKLGLERDDEIGTLSREFDGMMAKLEQARSELVDTARSAGKSEIATGILHNVGNVLNSVNVSALMVGQIADEMSLGDLEQISRILEENQEDLARFVTSDARGKHLQPFLAAITEQLGKERASLMSELSTLSQGVEHICELIKSQQSFATKTTLEEELQLAVRMDEALRITQQACAPDPDLVVVRDYEELPDVLVDKHRLLEILVNLVQNARQAMLGEYPRKVLTVSIARHGDRARLTVSDTGMGIEPEVLTKIFNLGFTTKPRGHGYGLHTAANAATEMGGSLRAESDGPGCGARFVLELPLKTRASVGGAA